MPGTLCYPTAVQLRIVNGMAYATVATVCPKCQTRNSRSNVPALNAVVIGSSHVIVKRLNAMMTCCAESCRHAYNVRVWG